MNIAICDDEVVFIRQLHRKISEMKIPDCHIDDTTSYGSETITLSWTDNGGYGIYSVYDFTNGGNNDSYELSYSSAKVVVYKGSKILKTYYVPTGKQGTRWLVCNINDGKIETVNEIV